MTAETQPPLDQLRDRVLQHLQVLYGDRQDGKPAEKAVGNSHGAVNIPAVADEIINLMGFRGHMSEPVQHANHWDQSDVVMICYGDSILRADEKPLQTLHRFLQKRLANVVSGVHILPFYPYSSDDGFSVIHYQKVNESLGDWSDIRRIADDFKLMADLVINHCSSLSGWFDNYKQGKHPGANYFFEASVDDDLSAVVRPRTSPLLRPTETLDGEKHVWCTFSHDQVDLDFRNPDVLMEFVRILRHYLDNGVQIFRLDAVAFLWKIVGNASINLPETHEVVRLLRTLAEHYRADAIMITETNIPNRENLSYFGNRNEAHLVYNFSLPPLLVNTLVTGNCQHLKTWLMSMPPAQPGTTYFNFIASHDGIGLRPAEGLLSTEEINQLVEAMQAFGGRVSWRALDDGQTKPYEINISLVDALSGTLNGPDGLGHARFICAHAIMLALEGLPAFYIHSLLATGNDYERLEHTSHARAINRHKWDESALDAALDDSSSSHSQIFTELTELIAIRKRQRAFHPNAVQFTLQLGNQLFGFWRQSLDREQSIFAVSNISNEPQQFSLTALNLIELDVWHDLLTGVSFDDLQADIELRPYQTIWISNR